MFRAMSSEALRRRALGLTLFGLRAAVGRDCPDTQFGHPPGRKSGLILVDQTCERAGIPFGSEECKVIGKVDAL